MSNSRAFRPGRQARRASMKDQLRAKDRELAYLRGMSLGLEAQLAATKMERPADLEDWISNVAIPDMSDEERAQWDAMSPDERETFLDELGVQINASQKLLALDAGAPGSPAPSAAGS
jgi:hypothetical protein